MSGLVPHFCRLVLAALAFAVLPLTAHAAWIAGRGADASGMTYLAVINDSISGERIELNCTPSGQVFLALTWHPVATPPGQGALTLRFAVGGSHRFAASARLRPLESGWAAAEVIAPEVIAPLTEALSIASGTFQVTVISNKISLVDTEFDLDAAAEVMARYRAYCRM